MPLYRCAIAPGRSNETQRAQIAKEVVRVHCGVTGAPASFVHAFFSERPAAELPDGQVAFVFGTIRAGRTDAQKTEIVSELRKSVATALGCAEAEVGAITVDIPAKWNMEGGSLLPEPGEEAAWFEAHRS
ncbi:MAG: DNA-binding protein [Myxococcota bacterium]